MHFGFDKKYFLLFVLLFVLEILIALFLTDGFIRPYAGDFLVVIMLYCLVKTFFKTPLIPTALAVLLFAYLVEALQYVKLVKLLGWQHSTLANVVLGNSFSWQDILAYTLGILLVIWVEQTINRKRAEQTNTL